MKIDTSDRPWLKLIPRFIRKDFVRKLMAVILASIIYVAVLDRLSTNHEIPGITVPIKPPPGFVLMEEGNPVVKVTVSGSQSLLKRLKVEDFSVSGLEIDPSNYQEGEPYILPLSPSNIHAPLGISVVSVSPESLRVDIDKQITKELHVQAVYDSKMPLPPGYAISKITVSPQNVRITGPSVIVAKLNNMKTLPISLDGMTQSFDVNAEVQVSRPDIKVSPGKVLVQTEIKREIERKTYVGLPIRIMKGKDNESAEVDLLNTNLVSVIVSAPSEILRKLSPGEIKVYVDISDLGKSGNHELDLGCWIADNGVIVESIHPKKVKVKIK